MTILIPMAGLSSRFLKAGYTLPKYMLYIKDKSLFYLAVESFRNYFKTSRFVFVARDVYDTKKFIENECKLLGIDDFSTVMLEKPTKGQAETVALGIERAQVAAQESILIFNIDTIRKGFTLPYNIGNCDGYLECFEGSGANWSYAKTMDGSALSNVIETAEKKEISKFCSTGIYYFKQSSDFMEAYSFNQGGINQDGVKELYVAPLYNKLIQEGKVIKVNLIDRQEVIFCGVPKEYEGYLKDNIK